MNILEIHDKSGRKIYLPKKQWSHIMKKHPYIVNHIEKIKEVIQKPDKITISNVDNSVRYYYKYYKELASPSNYILVVVKYLNGNGFIISVYFEKNIK